MTLMAPLTIMLLVVTHNRADAGYEHLFYLAQALQRQWYLFKSFSAENSLIGCLYLLHRVQTKVDGSSFGQVCVGHAS